MTIDQIRAEFTRHGYELTRDAVQRSVFNIGAACAEILRLREEILHLRAIVALVRSLDDEESQQQLRSDTSVFVKARLKQMMDAARGTG